MSDLSRGVHVRTRPRSDEEIRAWLVALRAAVDEAEPRLRSELAEAERGVAEAERALAEAERAVEVAERKLAAAEHSESGGAR